MELFEKRFLNVILNGEQVHTPFNKLFDSRVYDELCVVSYVSSFKFLFHNIAGFNKVTVILGEDETSKRFLSLNNIPEIELLEQIDDVELCKKIITRDVVFRRISDENIVHSKLYLAKKDGRPSRVAVGSANFTFQAFNGKQFEELIVFDDERYLKIYSDRFSYLLKESTDFLTQLSYKKLEEVVIKAETVKAKTISNSTIIANDVKALTIENSVILTPDEKCEMLLDRCEKTKGDAETVYEHLEKQKETIYTMEKEIKTVSEIFDNITKMHKNKRIFKSKSEINLIKDKIKSITTITSKKSEEYLDKRSFLVFKNFSLFKEFENEKGDREAKPLSNGGISEENLNEQLQKIESFIKSYTLFTINKNLDNEKKVFEAILYAMMSPLIWMIRKDVANKFGQEKLAEIPLMLILGGQANTGKSKLLMFINKLVGNDFDVFNYKDLDTREHRVIADMLESENIFPIFIDEIEQKFFDSPSGQALIKNATNKLTKPHPCIIGTTNKEFSPRAEIIRRLHYIHFTEPFEMSKSSKRKEEADEYLATYVGNVDDTVFKHFTSLLLARVKENSDDFYNQRDVLQSGRTIIKELFESYGIRTDFISQEFLGDYYKVSSEEWRAIYALHRDKFQERVDGGERILIVDLDNLTANSQYRNKSEILRNKLPPEVIKTPGTSVLVLRKDDFKKFIGDYESGLSWRIKNLFRKD
ncbi:MAG: phospholipase D family protein [bacterium]